MERLFPGVWKFRFGEPEPVTPVSERHKPPAAEALNTMPSPEDCPLAGDVSGDPTSRGFLLRIGLGDGEQLYGLGLQLLSHTQRGCKKMLRVNSDPRVDLGDSHAPVPFYVSTAGYGVLVDTARYATFHLGGAQPADRSRGGAVHVDVPHAGGVDVYVFAGPTPLEAVQRYNLFSGGGCLPPRWGLGVWYRCHRDFDQGQVVRLSETFSDEAIPCDVIGLEPGWQTHTYPCTWVWSEGFPDPAAMTEKLRECGVRVNLWTHVFVHDDCPLHAALENKSGTFRAFGGLTPDLADPEVRALIAEQHGREHVDRGTMGYKLDECDNSDYVRNWSFPEMSAFPSGLDGEQMHSLIGRYYQESIDALFRARNLRALHQVRSSGALAAPYPFVLYSDLYDHREFIRGVVSAGFSGLLWSPEVRHAASGEDLIRRIQSVVLSPHALINAWYIQNPPWKHWDRDANNRGELHPGQKPVEAICREWLHLRVRLVPYLYEAFFRYWREGAPPFRALALDWPDDEAARAIDDQYMIGDRLMAAPVVAGSPARSVYLPEGRWFDFWTGEALEGGHTIEVDVPLERSPLYVRGDAVLPLLVGPCLHAADPGSCELGLRVYGAGALPARLIVDDGETFAFEKGDYRLATFSWDDESDEGSVVHEPEGDAAALYHAKEWVRMGR